MSSTNKTTHYNLSQYIGSDKPTYLVDYNADMSAIDSGIYAAKDEADTNATSIGTLSSLTTEAKSNLVGAINEVDAHADTNAGNISTNTTDIATNTSHIGTMTNLNTTEKSNLVGAVNELKANIDNVNLSTFESPTSATTDVGSISYNNLSVAKNSDGSLAKIYGALNVTGISNQSRVNISFMTTLRPTTEITINCLCVVKLLGGTDTVNIGDLTIKTTGECTVSSAIYSTTTDYQLRILPCLLFIKDFGDAPIPD